MGSALHARVPPRRAAVILFAVGLMLSAAVNHAVAQTAAASVPPRTPVARTPRATAGERARRPARVLLIGDSVLDQQGGAAAFLLRQAGVDVEVIGLWGSGLLTVDQYDYGTTKRSGLWLRRAAEEIARFDPDLVGVYLNHNYWPPYPHDAAGRVITDLWSPAGQRMIGRQAQALVTILRARGADVFFVTPIPTGTTGTADPGVWNPIWHGYAPVLRTMRVGVADSADPVETGDGLRAETKPSCTGAPRRVRPAGDIHLTRFGAGLAGTALAAFVAARVGADLVGNAAPGDDTAALVPTRDGRGYWLVGCDGSVYRFGSAVGLPGARAATRGHGGVVAAVASPTGAGLWLVSADGTIAAVGDAPPLALRGRATSPVTAATGVPGAFGLWAATASGAVLAAGVARAFGAAGTTGARGKVVGIGATPDGRGYLLATSDGAVLARGDARARGSLTATRLDAPIVGLAPTPDGRGYWLVGRDGGIFSFGDARFCGNGIWHRPPYPRSVISPDPGPAVGLSATPGSLRGYWIVDATGRVASCGDARSRGGDNNLALFTP